MRECCGGRRAQSVPTFLIPSEVMGEYEIPKDRRKSEPVKRTVGLYPLHAACTYGSPPEYYSPLPPYIRRNSKPKVYSSYAVNRQCGIHGSNLIQKQTKQRSFARDYSPEVPRDEDRVRTWTEKLRRPSVSSVSSAFSVRQRTTSLSPERLRRSTPSPSFSSRPSSRRSMSSERSSSGDSSLEREGITYISRQVVEQRPDLYRILCEDLKEALKEEEGEEDDEDGDEDEEIIEAYRAEERKRDEESHLDSMGILGLSNKLFNETRTNQETFLAANQFRDMVNTSRAAL